MVLEGDDGPDFVGINDGFFLDNARLIVNARKGALDAVVSIDGAVDRRAAANTAQGQVDVGLKDAWVGYTVADALKIQAGKYKPPFDAEELQSTRSMFFIERAVESRGVRGVEGYNVEGLIPRRAGLWSVASWSRWGFCRLTASVRSMEVGRISRSMTTISSRIPVGSHSTTTPTSTWGSRSFQSTDQWTAPDLLNDEELAYVVDMATAEVGPSASSSPVSSRRRPRPLMWRPNRHQGDGIPQGIRPDVCQGLLLGIATISTQPRTLKPKTRSSRPYWMLTRLSTPSASAMPSILGVKVNCTLAQEDEAGP